MLTFSMEDLSVVRVLAEDDHTLTLEVAKSDDMTFTLDPETPDEFYFILFVKAPGESGAEPRIWKPWLEV